MNMDCCLEKGLHSQRKRNDLNRVQIVTAAQAKVLVFDTRVRTRHLPTQCRAEWRR